VALIHKAEVRLQDQTRKVEGCMQTRIELLDQLVSAAQQEIKRLGNLLAKIRQRSKLTEPTCLPNVDGQTSSEK